MENTGFKFCNQCGAELINGACPKCSKADIVSQQTVTEKSDNKSEKYKSFFMNPDEKFVCALGNNYIQNFLADGSVKKGFAVVSDKRVYFKGKSYNVSGKRLNATNEEKVVDLKDVTETGVRSIKYPVFLIMGIIALIVIFLIAELIYRSVGVYGGRVDYSRDIFNAVVAIVLSSPFFIAFFTTMKTILAISYAGGCIAFNVKWYSKKESDKFQNKLRIAKDRAVEKAANAAANAVREAVSSVAAPSVQSAPIAQPSQTEQTQAVILSADELTKYAQLYKEGLISEEEFANIKAKYFANNT